MLMSPNNSEGGVDIKKVGRPFSENPKDIRLTIRLDKKHDDILKSFANRNCVTKNEAIRQGIERLDEDK